MSTDSKLLIREICITPFGFALVGISDAGIQHLHISESRRDIEHLTILPAGAVARGNKASHAQQTTLRASIRLLEGGQPLDRLPLDLRGTLFQQLVWNYLRSIPSGEIRTYREVAQAIGCPNAFRAVARACAQNTIALAIPCHRVVRSDGMLGGYRWGERLKRELLGREAREAQKN